MQDTVQFISLKSAYLEGLCMLVLAIFIKTASFSSIRCSCKWIYVILYFLHVFTSFLASQAIDNPNTHQITVSLNFYLWYIPIYLIHEAACPQVVAHLVRDMGV